MNSGKTEYTSVKENAGYNYNTKLANKSFENVANFSCLGTTLTTKLQASINEGQIKIGGTVAKKECLYMTDWFKPNFHTLYNLTPYIPNTQVGLIPLPHSNVINQVMFMYKIIHYPCFLSFCHVHTFLRILSHGKLNQNSPRILFSYAK